MSHIIIDALANTYVYAEKKNLITITANSKRNNDGLLRIDDVDNQLISRIDSGQTTLSKVKKYNGKDYLLLYNPTTKQIQLVKEGMSIDLPIDFIKGVQYYVGAKRVLATKHIDNVFDIDLEGYHIFKVYLDNGIELTNYVYKNKKLTVRGMERGFIDELSEIVLFIYLDNTIPQGHEFSVSRDENNSSHLLKFEDKETSLEFILEYYNYDTVYYFDTFIDNSYFERLEYVGIELVCFDKININENIEKESSRNNFSICDKIRIKKVEVTAELETFDVDEFTDMVQYIGKDEFRLVFINPVSRRIVLLNNCFLDNGIPMVFQKEGNMKTCKLSCGNYIDIKISESIFYGKGKYGKGLYGSGTWVTNSYRREV